MSGQAYLLSADSNNVPEQKHPLACGLPVLLGVIMVKKCHYIEL